MINQVISAVIDEINTYIGTTEPDVVLGNISMIDAFQDSSTQTLSDKVIASVVNIAQEKSLRNLPFRRSVWNGGETPEGVEQQPEIYLNIYLLLGANKSEYSIALQRISQVISFFQRQYVFTPANLPVLGTLDLDKIIFDLYSTNFEELNQMWSIMGGKYIPSVIYKMRLAMIQDAEEQETGIITEIQRDLDNWDPLEDSEP